MPRSRKKKLECVVHICTSLAFGTHFFQLAGSLYDEYMLEDEKRGGRKGIHWSFESQSYPIQMCVYGRGCANLNFGKSGTDHEESLVRFIEGVKKVSIRRRGADFNGSS
jgi:hypothetical protein